MRAATRCLVLPLVLGLAAGLAGSQPSVPAAGDLTFLDDPIDGDCLIAGELTLPPGGKLQLVINYQDDGSCYLLDVEQPWACFYKAAAGQMSPVGPKGELKALSPGAPAKFAVARRNCRLAFIYNGLVVCRGWDDSLSNGKAGYAVTAAVIGDPLLQPAGPIRSSDDFVRQEDTRHMWTELTGSWDIQKLRDDDQADEMEADKSANAFVYHVVSNGPALSLAEKETWFWDNYHLGGSARSMGKGALGLVVLGQDEKNYLLFRWASSWAKDAQGDRAQLVEMVDGRPNVLAEKPGGFIPERWYQLDLGLCDGDIVCSIDGSPVLRGHSDRFGLGNPGVYSEGPEGSYFDDIVIEDYESFQDDFASLTRWRAAQGDWSSTGRAARCAASGLAGVPVVSPTMKDERLVRIAALGCEYLYATLRAGTTGSFTRIDPGSLSFLRKIGSVAEGREVKILGGFGVSTWQQVEALGPHVHAVVVGSAFVREIAKAGDPYRAVREKMRELVGG